MLRLIAVTVLIFVPSISLAPSSVPATETVPLTAYDAMLTAANDAGFAAAGDLCVLDCDSGEPACEGDQAHKAPTGDDDNDLGTGDHTLCETGFCWEHEHYVCDPQFAAAESAFRAISSEDWVALAAMLDSNELMQFNVDRAAIQIGACDGEGIGGHIPAPHDFLVFLAEQP